MDSNKLKNRKKRRSSGLGDLKTPPVKENFESLYDTIVKEHADKEGFARIILLIKIKQNENKKDKKDKKDKKSADPQIIETFIKKIKKLTIDLSKTSNLIIVFMGSLYVFVGIENSTENIMKLANIISKEDCLDAEQVKVIYYNEEFVNCSFPVFYCYEGELYEKDVLVYKEAYASEKGWILYNKIFFDSF